MSRTRPLLLGILLLGIIGIGIAGYLTYVHYNEDALVCTTGGCETVQQSEYSTIGDIPIAIFGLLMFTTVTLLAAARLAGRLPISFEMATMLAWTMLLTSLLYYAYLTYIEVFELEAICQWCVSSSIIGLLMFVLESILLFRDASVEAEQID
jgi:uncharacterized membrane protein